MKRLPFALILTGGIAAAFAAPSAFAIAITLTAISTPFPTPIGIDHYEPTNKLVMSVNYASGLPHALELVAADGTHTPFSALSGVTDEVKIATVRPGNVGGFTTGDLFVGNGVDGQIVRVTGGGATVINPWVDLPGAGNGLMRGSLYVDRTGVWGGDLIAVTTAGQVWRIKSDGTTTPAPLASVGVHLEGVITVPGDATKYGPLAGKIIAGAEGSGLMYIIGTDGSVTTFDPGVTIEDIDLVTPNENFFGVNFGTSRLLGAPASQFTSIVGDILLTDESVTGSGLYRLFWNGSTLVTEALSLGAGSFIPGQWEHVTFSSAGIVEIKSTTPEPATLLLTALGLAVLASGRRRRAAPQD